MKRKIDLILDYKIVRDIDDDNIELYPGHYGLLKIFDAMKSRFTKKKIMCAYCGNMETITVREFTIKCWRCNGITYAYSKLARNSKKWLYDKIK